MQPFLRVDAPDHRYIPSIYVVIPFKGKVEMTATLVAQLVEQNEFEKIFLFDNDGVNTGPRYPWSIFNSKVITHDAPGANIHEMWNTGYAWAEYEARYSGGFAKVAFLNNDIVIPPKFLSTLAGALDADPILAAVGPELEGDDREWNTGECGFHGSAFMVRADEIHQPFDQNLQWWYGDDDFCVRARVRGLKVAMVRGLKHEHIGGGSQTPRTDEFWEAVRQDREYFYSKWAYTLTED